jgi:LPS sulfotransferase NodH
MYVDKDMRRAILELAHRPSATTLRRAAFIDGMMGLHATVSGVLELSQRLDERLYGDFHQVHTGEPFFIVAAPRSGTTLLHRLMALDPQFTTLKLSDTILPSISATKVMQTLRTHPALGGLLDRLSRGLEKRVFKGWEGIHTTALGKDEEDETLWVFLMATPSMLMCAPFPEELEQVMYPDTLPEEKRLAMTRFFRECMQRHLYLHPGKTLLCKNVMLSGRYRIVTDALPNSRFVHIARHPYQAITSAVSMFTTPWRFHSPDIPLDSKAHQRFADMFVDYYRFMFDRCQESLAAGDGRFFDLTYDELTRDPANAVRRIYRHYGLELTPAFERKVVEELGCHQEYASSHRYTLEQYGLTEDRIYEPLADIFEHYGFAR